MVEQSVGEERCTCKTLYDRFCFPVLKNHAYRKIQVFLCDYHSFIHCIYASGFPLGGSLSWWHLLSFYLHNHSCEDIYRLPMIGRSKLEFLWTQSKSLITLNWLSYINHLAYNAGEQIVGSVQFDD